MFLRQLPIAVCCFVHKFLLCAQIDVARGNNMKKTLKRKSKRVPTKLRVKAEKKVRICYSLSGGRNCSLRSKLEQCGFFP